MQKEKPEKTAFRLVLTAALVAAVVVGGLIALLFFAMPKKEKEPPQAAVTTPAPEETEALSAISATPVESGSGAPSGEGSGEEATPSDAESKARPVRIQVREWLDPLSVKASSMFPKDIDSYEAEHAIDNNPNTAWLEGAAGSGEGEYIELTFPKGVILDSYEVLPGFCKREDLFFNNCAPTKLEFSSGGKSVTVDISPLATDYFEAIKGGLRDLPEALPCDGTLRVTIRGARRGKVFQNAGFSLLRFEGYSSLETGSDGEVVITEHTCNRMLAEANRLWQHLQLGKGYDIDVDADILVSELSAEDRAFLEKAEEGIEDPKNPPVACLVESRQIVAEGDQLRITGDIAYTNQDKEHRDKVFGGYWACFRKTEADDPDSYELEEIITWGSD